MSSSESELVPELGDKLPERCWMGSSTANAPISLASSASLPEVWVQCATSCPTEPPEDSTVQVLASATLDASHPGLVGSSSAWSPGLVLTSSELAAADAAAAGLLVAGDLGPARTFSRTRGSGVLGEHVAAVSRLATGEPNTFELGSTPTAASSTALCRAAAAASSTALCKAAAAANEISAFSVWSRLAGCSATGAPADGSEAGKTALVLDHQAGGRCLPQRRRRFGGACVVLSALPTTTPLPLPHLSTSCQDGTCLVSTSTAPPPPAPQL